MLLVDESVTVGCTVPMIADEVYVNNSVSLTDLLTISEGIITEGVATDEVMEYSIFDEDKDITADVVIALGDVLEYSAVDRGGSIDDSTLDSKVIEGKTDSVGDSVTIMFVVILVSIAMTWDSVLVVVLL